MRAPIIDGRPVPRKRGRPRKRIGADEVTLPTHARLPLEPLTVRIPMAMQLTGLGRSKLYELIKAGDLKTVKVGTSTLVTVASLRELIDRHAK